MTKASDNQYPKVTFLESSAPSTPASTLGYLYEKTDGKLYFKNDGGTETELTAAGSSPATTNLGYTTVGGTTDTLSASKYVAKAVTPTTTKPIIGIAFYCAGNASNLIEPISAIFDDNAGVPGKMVAWGVMSAIAYGPSMSATGRWLYLPIFYVPVASTQIWICSGAVINNANAGVFYYDGSGGDHVITGTTAVTDAGWGSATTRKYSLYAVQTG